MKTSFKLFVTRALVMVLGMGIVGTNVAVVQAQVEPRPIQRVVDADFCTQLPSLVNRTQTELNTFSGQVAAGQENRSDQIDKAEAAATERLNQKRTEWDELRAKHYEKLFAKAKTDTQTQAVQAFKDTIETAVVRRRAEVDKAVTVFSAGLTSLVSGQQNSIASVFTTFSTAINVATTQAQASCNAGVTPATVRLQLQQSVAAARRNLQSGDVGITKIRTDMNKLRAAREASIQATVKEFEQAAKAAADTLRPVLGQ